MSTTEVATKGLVELRDPVLEALFAACIEEANFLYRSLLKAKRQEERLLNNVYPLKDSFNVFSTPWFVGTRPFNVAEQELNGEWAQYGQQIGMSFRNFTLRRPPAGLWLTEGPVEHLTSETRGGDVPHHTTRVIAAISFVKLPAIDCWSLPSGRERPEEYNMDIETGSHLRIALQDGIQSLNL